MPSIYTTKKQIERKLHAAKDRVDSLTNKLDELADKKEHLQVRIQKISQKAGRFYRTMKMMDKKIAEANMKATQVKGAKALWYKTKALMYKAIKAIFVAIVKVLKMLSKKYKDRIQRIEKLEKETQEVSNKAKGLLKEMSKAATDYTSLQTKRDSLSTKISELRKKIKLNPESREKVNSLINRLASQYAQLSSKTRETINKIVGAQKMIDGYMVQVDKAIAEGVKVDPKIEQEIKEYKALIDKLRKTKAEYEKQLDEIATKMKELHGMVK